jgi:hypothetical protein
VRSSSEISTEFRFVERRDTAKARVAYKDFLNLWKDADPDIPILKEAQGGVRGAAIVKLGTPFLLHRSAIKLTNVNCSS